MESRTLGSEASVTLREVLAAVYWLRSNGEIHLPISGGVIGPGGPAPHQRLPPNCETCGHHRQFHRRPGRRVNWMTTNRRMEIEETTRRPCRMCLQDVFAEELGAPGLPCEEYVPWWAAALGWRPRRASPPA